MTQIQQQNQFSHTTQEFAVNPGVGSHTAPDVMRAPSRLNISRRALLKSAATIAACAALAACTPRLSTLSPAANKVRLVFQDCRCLGEQLLLQQFHETHPDIEVFYIPDPENFEEKMLADMQAGTAPDLLVGCCDTLPIWAQKGYLLNLRPYVEADLEQETIDDWDEAQYKSFFSADGIQFALPKYHGALALYYNKDLFDRYGVNYPSRTWSYEDYLQAMLRLTADQDGDGKTDLWGSMVDISWDRIQVHVNGFGGHFVDPQDPTRSWMAHPEALRAMEWIRARMWDDHVMATKLDVQNLATRDAFVQQRLAMVEDGSWALRDILEQADFRIGIAPFPAGPVRRVTLATTDGFAVYAGTKYPEAAWELIKFFVGRDYGKAMAQTQLLQPARASLVEDWIGYISEQYPEKSEGLEIGAFADGHIEGYSVTAEVFANMTDARQLTRSAWEEIFTLGQARVDVMKRTSAMIEKSQPGNV
jgi:multiple sugar transport system substrate-binding protein